MPPLDQDVSAQSANGAAPDHIDQIPTHVAIVMDGNGRWAQQQGLPRNAGHQAGTENIRRVIESFADFGVKYLTLYAFSTENWSRPIEEVDYLLNLVPEVLDRELTNLHKNGARLKHIGRLEGLSPEVRQAVVDAIELTKENDRITVNLAFNYGGRAEILDAVQAMLKDGVNPNDVSEQLFSRYLYTAGTPDPDLIIRTAGEIRLSNFLIWQAAYSEYYWTSVFWPDFGKDEVQDALVAYSRRKRRFGGLVTR